MPVLTRDMIAKQKMARNTARLSAPSTPSSHLSSRTPSLSGSPASTSSSLSRSPAQSSRDHTSPDKCWVPNLDQVSRADRGERARLFTKLVQEATRDAQNGTPRIPRRKVNASTPRYLSSRSSGYSSVETGEVALQLVSPPKERPIEHPNLLTPMWDYTDDSASMDFENQDMLPELFADVPDSPVTSSFSMNRGHVSDEVIAGWAREDAEMEMAESQAQNDRLRKLGCCM